MDQIMLEKGVVYRGRICVFHWNATIDKLGGGTPKIKQMIADQGFSDVSVWRNGEPLPADWPDDKRSDPCSDACIWTQGTFNKETGMYPASNKDAAVHDQWVYKEAPKPQPVTPACSQLWAACALNADCCSQNCANGICALQQGVPPPPVNVTCGSGGMECANLNCCEGLTCQNYDGGMLCMKPEEPVTPPPEPTQPDEPTRTTSDWWYAAGAAAVVGIGWLILNRAYPSVPVTNPAERKTYRVLFDKPVPLNLVNKLVARARTKKLQIDLPRLDVSVDLIFVKAKDAAGADLVRRRFAEAWRETITAEFEERWGKDWYLRGGRDEYAPEFMKY